MKHVVIVNAGGFGQLSAEAGNYDTLVENLKRQINGIKPANGSEEQVANIEVVTSINEADKLLFKTDLLIFVTRGMQRMAARVKEVHPSVKVVVLTGLLPDDQVIFLNKSWLDADLVRSLVMG